MTQSSKSDELNNNRTFGFNLIRHALPTHLATPYRKSLVFQGRGQASTEWMLEEKFNLFRFVRSKEIRELALYGHRAGTLERTRECEDREREERQRESCHAPRSLSRYSLAIVRKSP